MMLRRLDASPPFQCTRGSLAPQPDFLNCWCKGTAEIGGRKRFRKNDLDEQRRWF